VFTTSGRVYNFSSGPSALPVEVLQRAREELLNYHDSQGQGQGMSIMEMSHRSDAYREVIEGAGQLLRELLGIPDAYQVLFLQGGATLQFSMVPTNLFTDAGQTADYIMTGVWAQKAMEEAQKVARVRMVGGRYTVADWSELPAASALVFDPDAVYVHMTSNNTICGTEFHTTPDTGTIPLVADMSSNILSRVLDVSRYGIIYAGAQKNLGPSGVTVVIVRHDLLERSRGRQLPVMLDYAVQAKHGSMLNTPPTFAIYMLRLVLEWARDMGGVAALEQRNIRKAGRLYAALDATGFYRNPVTPSSRSRMNIPFTIPARRELEPRFLAEAADAGLVALEGHRSVGGMRASIYNAMPESGVDALVDFLGEFERRYG
jgi:phosphoserine aminotransferase